MDITCQGLGQGCTKPAVYQVPDYQYHQTLDLCEDHAEQLEQEEARADFTARSGHDW